MKCEYCKEDYKHEFLSIIKVDAGEKVMLCNSCEERLKYLVKEQ
jgi:hypothetical protein